MSDEHALAERPDPRGCPLVDVPHSWDIKDDESPDHYRLFLQYLELGEGRSLRRLGAQRTEHGEKSHLNSSTLGPISSRHDWILRAQAYDIYLLRLAREKREEAIEAVFGEFIQESKQVAREMIREALSTRSSRHKVEALKDVLDRIGAYQPKDIRVSGTIELEHLMRSIAAEAEDEVLNGEWSYEEEDERGDEEPEDATESS